MDKKNYIKAFLYNTKTKTYSYNIITLICSDICRVIKKSEIQNITTKINLKTFTVTRYSNKNNNNNDDEK